MLGYMNLLVKAREQALRQEKIGFVAYHRR